MAHFDVDPEKNPRIYGSPGGISNLTDITPADLGLEDGEEKSAEEKLDDLIWEWLERLSSHVNTHLGEIVQAKEIEYKAIVDIVERKCSDLISVALQKRTDPVIRIDEFAISILNSTDAIQDLESELQPFIKKRKSKKTRVYFTGNDER